MSRFDLFEVLKSYNSVSIIGMDKNVGKTTVLNHIISKARGKIKLGLTSIGRDGEEEDRVTFTEKPRIYVEKGTYIATAKECVFNGDITKEILENTNISTAMGDVIIVRALSDGYVELGGPSQNYNMIKVCNKLKCLGTDLILVDGALSRKSFASPAITDATILATGASLSRNLEKVVEKTAHTVRLLSLEAEEDTLLLEAVSKIDERVRVCVIAEDYEVHSLSVLTALNSSKEVLENINHKTKAIYVRGILSDRFVEDILKNVDREILNKLIIIVDDGTKVFVSKDALTKLLKVGGFLKVINKINLICVTVNPKSPYAYEFDRDRFISRLRDEIPLPILDVKREDEML